MRVADSTQSALSRSPAALLAVLVGTFISVTGDSAASIALVLSAASEGPTWGVTEVFLSELLPPLVFAPVLGVLVDRVNVRLVWIAATLLQAATFVTAALLDSFHLWVAMVSLSGVFAVASGSAAFKLLPELAGAWGTQRANSAMSATTSSAFLIGPAAGAATYAFAGPQPIFLVNAASFLVVAVVVIAVVPKSPRARIDIDGSPFDGAREGLKVLRRSPIVGPLPPLLAAVVLTTSVEGVAGVFYLREVAGSDAVYGVLLSCWAAGSIPGALCGGLRLLTGKDQLLVIGGAALISLALLVEGLIPSAAVIGIAFVLGGFGNGAHNVGVRNSIHHGVPSSAYGRSWAYYSAMANTCVGLGYLLGTPTELLDSQQLVILSGAVATAVTIGGAVAVRRRSRKN